MSKTYTFTVKSASEELVKMVREKCKENSISFIGDEKKGNCRCVDYNIW